MSHKQFSTTIPKLELFSTPPKGKVASEDPFSRAGSTLTASTALSESNSPINRLKGKPLNRLPANSIGRVLSPEKPKKPLSKISDVPMTDLTMTSSSAAMEMVQPLNMQALTQLGEPDPSAINRQDLLSAIAFDRTGKILSVGDRGGRIICFNLTENDKGQQDFEYLTEFVSHEKSFDALQSQDIAETINAIEWVNDRSSASPALLTCNNRTIKLHRVVTKSVKRSESVVKRLARGKGLTMPRMRAVEKVTQGEFRTSYSSGSEQHLHSLSLAPDMENFLSADESHINLWSLERAGERPVYSVVDYNRKKFSHDDELITKAHFSQNSPMFLYTTSQGRLRVCDFREASSFH